MRQVEECQRCRSWDRPAPGSKESKRTAAKSAAPAASSTEGGACSGHCPRKVRAGSQTEPRGLTNEEGRLGVAAISVISMQGDWESACRETNEEGRFWKAACRETSEGRQMKKGD